MKHLGAAITILILFFWSAMNSFLVRRQIEEQQLGLYQQKVHRFLHSTRHRERWLSVYKHTDRRRRKVGYTGTILEVRQGPQGTEYHTEIETVINMEVFGQGAELLEGLLGTGYLEIAGFLIQDAEMRPLNLTVDLMFPNQRHIMIQGERVEDRFILKAHHENLPIPPLSLPLEKLTLGNSLVPDLPVAGLREGEKFRVTTFDPVFFTTAPVDVEVVSLDTQEVDGVLVDVYTLESTFRGSKSTTLVTRDGTLLKMKLGPPFQGISLQHETAETARQGIAADSRTAEARRRKAANRGGAEAQRQEKPEREYGRDAARQAHE